MRFKMVPTDDRFFDLFREAAENVAECSRRLRDLLASDFSDLEGMHARIIECEQRGDALTRDIVRRLNSTFVTPFSVIVSSHVGIAVTPG